MKNLYTILVALLITTSVFGQAPEKMSYQAVLRDASNTLLTNQEVGMQISILQTTITGTAVYTETQTAITNINGLVSIEIGSGTSSDNFSAIDWSAGPYFIKTATDPTGGSSYSITGTSALLTVPFAMYAKTSGSSIPGPQGAAGIQGATGTNGTNGAQGIQGATGPAGPRGVAGDTGVKGDTGATGTNGTNGAQGIQGATGSAGAQGIVGDTGDTGATGATGTNGTNGAQGIQGATGPAGPRGVAGDTGVKGDTGATGTNGTNGAQGIQGATGPAGVQGIVGDTGEKGEKGDTGATGATGATGVAGTNGTNGAQGIKGATGSVGAQGIVGDTGATGATGTNGTNGAQGIQGAAGATGAKGEQGLKGDDGANGVGIAQTLSFATPNLVLSDNGGSIDLTDIINATHTGDVTGATALTITTNAVTTDKILDNNVTDAKIVAVSASKLTGTVSVANGGTNITTFTPGDILYATSATELTKLPAGTAGQVLTMNTGATAPEWVTRATLAIGQVYQGGIIFYLDASGYHGLIAPPSDQSVGIEWDNGTYTDPTAFASCVGCGDGNTSMIVYSKGSGSYAAKLCYDLDSGGNTDWYLPSKYELNLMYENIGPGNVLGLGNIGSFSDTIYWSSTESDSVYAWYQDFFDGFQYAYNKDYAYGSVRAVRAF
jgi:hypothetical protein